MRVRFEVSFSLPAGATAADAKEYVADAVCSMCGALKPPDSDPEDPDGNPMFTLDRDTVKVITKRKIK